MRPVPKNPFITLNITKVPWKWLAAVLLAVMLIFANIYLYEELTRLPAKEAVMQAYVKTVSAPSYRFNALSVRIFEGKESVISEVRGEKTLKGVHIAGSLPIIKAEVEIYHLGDILYRRDTVTEGWVVVPDKGRPAIEQLIAEINPLGAFHFSEQDNIDAKYVGKQKINRKNCRIYEVMGQGINKYMELYWQDFRYRLWIDKKEGVIRQAQIMAEHRDNSQHLLQVTIDLSDFEEQIEIEPPLTGS